MMSTNLLLNDWDTPFSLPPFQAIKDEHFSEALDYALSHSSNLIKNIADNPETPTFENTIERMEVAEKLLNKVAGVFFNLSHADSNTLRQRIETEFSPKFAKYSSDIYLNEKLFKRIKFLWEDQSTKGCTDEQQRVLELYYEGFIRAGSNLDSFGKNRIREIKEKLASLHTLFNQKILKEESSWYLEIPEAELESLPNYLVVAMKEAAKERKIYGHIVTLNRSLIVPFLEHSPNRDLRKTAYEAWINRGNNKNENNTLDTIKEIFSLRYELANILSFSSYADYKLDDKMAKSPHQVRELLETVWKPAKQKALEDAAVLQTMLEMESGNTNKLEPWDWRYFSQKRKSSEFNFDDTKVKNYFQLENMIEAAFDCANKLFELTFEPIVVSLYHSDCKAWEVKKNGKHLAIFIGDYFARPSKRSGAWCSSLRSQSNLNGSTRPVVINVCNFLKAPEGEPNLLSFDDARTLFHEFGHALHNMLSDVTYESISGTSVVGDFVELPSQLFEHWMELPEVLKTFATHSETDQSLPDTMLKKLLELKNYDIGFATVEYLASAFVDLEMHCEVPPLDPLVRTEEILMKIGLPNEIKMRHNTSNFSHVFTNSMYSSGYYNYMWSEVMDADAFECFLEEGGPFSKNTARRLEKFILSAGNSQKAETLYKLFRGSLPKADALLRKKGLVTS